MTTRRGRDATSGKIPKEMPATSRVAKRRDTRGELPSQPKSREHAAALLEAATGKRPADMPGVGEAIGAYVAAEFKHWLADLRRWRARAPRTGSGDDVPSRLVDQLLKRLGGIPEVTLRWAPKLVLGPPARRWNDGPTSFAEQVIALSWAAHARAAPSSAVAIDLVELLGDLRRAYPKGLKSPAFRAAWKRVLVASDMLPPTVNAAPTTGRRRSQRPIDEASLRFVKVVDENWAKVSAKRLPPKTLAQLAVALGIDGPAGVIERWQKRAQRARTRVLVTH